MTRCIRTLAYSIVLASSLGCGDAGAGGAGGAGGSTGPRFEDVPEVPVPASPGGNVPARSAIHTTVRRVWHEWNPELKRVWGSWNNTGIGGNLLPTDYPPEDGWNDEVEPGGPCRDAVLQNGVYGRVKLIAQGFTIAPIIDVKGSALCVYRLETEGLRDPVYIRRDRHWQVSQLDGGAGDFLLLEGNVQGTISSSVTTGSSVTQTEEFSHSLSATAGPPFLMVSGSLEETFSTAITIEESATETFEQTVFGEAGKLTHFQVWELVETYSFSDEDGNPVEHELYEFVEQTFVRRGAATFLQATEFDR